MRSAGIGAALIGALMFGSAGQATAADAMEGFKAETIKAIFVELGATDVQSVTAQGDPRLTFKLNDLLFVVDFFQCEDKARGCNVMQYVLFFEPDASDTVEVVNRYNAEYVFGKAVLDSDGLVSMRGLLWSPGSSKAHVVNEFGMFLTSTRNLLEFLKKGVTASAPSGDGTAKLSGIKSVQVDAVDSAVTARLKGLPKNRR
jgi:hypothetical protein